MVFQHTAWYSRWKGPAKTIPPNPDILRNRTGNTRMGNSQYIQGKTGFFNSRREPLYFSPISAFRQPLHDRAACGSSIFLRIFNAR